MWAGACWCLWGQVGRDAGQLLGCLKGRVRLSPTCRRRCLPTRCTWPPCTSSSPGGTRRAWRTSQSRVRGGRLLFACARLLCSLLLSGWCVALWGLASAVLLRFNSPPTAFCYHCRGGPQAEGKAGAPAGTGRQVPAWMRCGRQLHAPSKPRHALPQLRGRFCTLTAQCDTVFC